jgi:GTP-binding protein HflX
VIKYESDKERRYTHATKRITLLIIQKKKGRDIMFETAPKQEKAILVSVNLGDDYLFNYQLEELVNLCAACGIEVIDTLTQNLRHIHPATYVGKGKLDEIKIAVDAQEADVVIFNDELTPSQIKNIEELVDCKVIDRTMVILDIFEQRASTKEASLQVKLATLQYMLPRLIGSRRDLSRLGGSSGGDLRSRGAGETKLELDRRRLGDDIVKLKAELKEIVETRAKQREKRAKTEIPVVALVGYTNSGKSTTLNTILDITEGNIEKKVFAKDMLFATLETSTRNIKLKNNHEFLLTDTVGFVSKLPHHLVEAFKSTLEEIKDANLIIHIVDSFNEKFEMQVTTTNEVLKELGVVDIPTIYAFNKIDLHDQYFYIPNQFKDAIRISSITKDGFEELLKIIDEILFSEYLRVRLLIPYTRGDIVSHLQEKAEVISIDYQDQGTVIEVTLSKHLQAIYKDFIIQ